MRKTQFERTVNYYQFKEGMLVEQSPGYQLIHYSIGGMHSRKKQEFLLPMPWVRIWNPGAPGKGQSSIFAMWAKQSWKNEQRTGMIKGYYIALPCIMAGRWPCAVHIAGATPEPEVRALRMLQGLWSSSYCFHWESPHTWGNPFWESFGIDRPMSTHSIAGGDEAILKLLPEWEKLSLEDLDKMPFSTYDKVVDKVTFVEE